MPGTDPFKPAWVENQQESFADLQREANERKAKRENLQPLRIGKQNYGDIFRVGDRTRPELALSFGKETTRGDFGSGEVDLGDLIPPQALSALSHAIAQANVTALAEGMEGVREEMIFDADEAEVMDMNDPLARASMSPPVNEYRSLHSESAAYDPPWSDGNIRVQGYTLRQVNREEWTEAAPELRMKVDNLRGYYLIVSGPETELAENDSDLTLGSDELA